LGVAVHENHLFLAIPLTLLASVYLPAYRRVAVIIGVIQALNLFLFYGLSEGIGWTPVRDLTIVDATVWLAVAATGVYLWHVLVFTRATRVSRSHHQGTSNRCRVRTLA
jgi:hypothetical protein